MTKIAITKIPGRPDIELPAFYESFEWYYPHCELQTKEWFVKNAQPDWVYIDCGANIGYYSILFAQLSPAGFVHAVEPTITVDMLQRNLEYNNVKNGKIHRVALGEFSGARTDSLYRIWGEPAEENEYQFTTIDELLLVNRCERLDCIKIDVDSFDFEVLKGAEQTLLKYDPWVVIELSNSLALRNSSISEVLSWLRTRGYETAIILDKENFVFKRNGTPNNPREIPLCWISWLLERDILYDVGEKLHGLSVDIAWANNTFAGDCLLASACSSEFVNEFRKLTFPSSAFPGWQCFQYAAFVRTFDPECVLQFGRWGGEFTFALLLGMHYAESSATNKLWSYCKSTSWNTNPVYEQLVSNLGFTWLKRANLATGLPTNLELEHILNPSKRVLVFWNDPSRDSGDVVLGGVMPRVRNKDHVVILHGISDGRFGATPTYEGDGSSMLALGDAWSWRTDLPRILDFVRRNNLQLLSPERGFRNRIETQRRLANELRSSLGALFSTSAGWHWFTHNGDALPGLFPQEER